MKKSIVYEVNPICGRKVYYNTIYQSFNIKLQINAQVKANKRRRLRINEKEKWRV